MRHYPNIIFRSLLLTLVLAAQPALAALNIQKWTTPNGSVVHFVESHDLPMIDVQLDMRAGTAFDDPAKPGVAALTHALLDAGAGKLDEHAIADRLADAGAQISGGIDGDIASLSLRVLSSQRERDAGLDLLSTVLSKPRFDAAVLERERKSMLAELRESLTQPGTIGSRRFVAEMYGSHPYGRKLDEAGLRRITRAQLQAFHRQHYVAAALSITLVGDMSRAQAEAIAQQISASLPRGAAAPRLPLPAMPKAQTIRIPHPASQAHISIGHPGFARGDADAFPLVVGNYVLGGGGFVSRLTKAVRDARGLSYSVYSYFSPQLSAGPFAIGLQTQVAQADEALKVMREVLDTFLREGPTEAELQAAKDNLINGFALRLDSNRKLLQQVAVLGAYDLPLDYLDRYPERVRAVTVAQVRDAFARRVRPESLVTVVVGGEAVR